MSAFPGIGVTDSILWYKRFKIIYAGLEAGPMFTPEELRKAKIFDCLDEAECARLAQTIADVRLEPGEWLFREGAPACFYVMFDGSLRMVLDVLGKQTEFAQYELKPGEFLGEVPLLMGTSTFGSLRDQTSCRIARPSLSRQGGPKGRPNRIDIAVTLKPGARRRPRGRSP